MGVRRREEDLAVFVEEVTAGGLAFAVREAMHVGAIDMHRVLLIARVAVASGLKREAASIGAEVRLGVLTAVCELADVGEMPLATVGSDENGALLPVEERTRD